MDRIASLIIIFVRNTASCFFNRNGTQGDALSFEEKIFFLAKAQTKKGKAQKINLKP